MLAYAREQRCDEIHVTITDAPLFATYHAALARVVRVEVHEGTPLVRYDRRVRRFSQIASVTRGWGNFAAGFTLGPYLQLLFALGNMQLILALSAMMLFKAHSPGWTRSHNRGSSAYNVKQAGSCEGLPEKVAATRAGHP